MPIRMQRKSCFRIKHTKLKKIVFVFIPIVSCGRILRVFFFQMISLSQFYAIVYHNEAIPTTVE